MAHLIPLDVVDADGKIILGKDIVEFDTETGEVVFCARDKDGGYVIENGEIARVTAVYPAPLTTTPHKKTGEA